MNILAHTAQTLAVQLRDAAPYDLQLANKLLQDAKDYPQGINFESYSVTLLTLAMSPTVPDLFRIRTQLCYLAGITLNTCIEAMQARVPMGRATNAYIAMLSGLMTGEDMTLVAQRALPRLDISQATIIENGEGETLDVHRESLVLPTPVGTFVIDHVMNHYSGASRFDVLFTAHSPDAGWNFYSAETSQDVMRKIGRAIRAGRPAPLPQTSLADVMDIVGN